MNRVAWEGLSKPDQAAIENACGAAVANALARGEALQGPVLADYAERGVATRVLPLPLLRELESSELSENTIVVVAGDHGEGLDQRGYLGHGVDIHEELVTVPLIVRWPREIPGGRRIAEPVSLVDLMPTLSALMDLGDDAGIAGAFVLAAQAAEGA